MIRILTFSSLYPNAAQPHHGIFVEQRLRHLVASGRVDVRVVAPVPWFPFAHERFGEYARYAAAPHHESRHGIVVVHPRYPIVPKLGMSLAPVLMRAFVQSEVARLRTGGFAFDLIDAHYFYPDGVAAWWIGRMLRVPVVITARGTDVNLIPRHAIPRAMIRRSALGAAGIVAVCDALKQELVRIGVPSDRVVVLRNGVDLDNFRPIPPDEARRTLGVTGPTLLSVGKLIPRKGHHLAIQALSSLDGVRLMIVGDGPMEAELKRLAASSGVADRVRFEGPKSHSELPTYYSAADSLVLASDREGMANVLLESIACGTPVVATPFWGTPDVVASPEAGELMADRSVAALVAAVRALFARRPDRAATRRFAERFSWNSTTDGQLSLFEKIIAAAPKK